MLGRRPERHLNLNPESGVADERTVVMMCIIACMNEANNADNAEGTSDLAAINTMLALDRTLLAWMRTALTLIGFGFTLAKFVHDMIEHGMLHGVKPYYPRTVGFILMGLGVATLIGGGWEYVKLAKRVKPDATVWSVSLVVSSIVVVLALVLMVSLMTDLSIH